MFFGGSQRCVAWLVLVAFPAAEALMGRTEESDGGFRSLLCLVNPTHGAEIAAEAGALVRRLKAA